MSYEFRLNIVGIGQIWSGKRVFIEIPEPFQLSLRCVRYD